jgi:hypothetical protein
MHFTSVLTFHVKIYEYRQVSKFKFTTNKFNVVGIFAIAYYTQN